MQEMEAYKQTKDEEAMNLKKEEEELVKVQKQEALQLLKKKEKTENIIKVSTCCFQLCLLIAMLILEPFWWLNVYFIMYRKPKSNARRSSSRMLTLTSLRSLHLHSFFSGISVSHE